MMVAALFVLPDGPYASMPDVDLWPESRDARLYDGPHPVVAHPPCERWGRYWFGGPSARVRRKMGDDGGCFTSALASVRRWGGVLEHPEASHAWDAHGLASPPRWGGWIADLWGGWTCCVEQGHYGHPARKATWLYYVGREPPPDLVWGRSAAQVRLDAGFHSAEERRVAKAAAAAAGTKVQHSPLSARQRCISPPPIRMPTGGYRPVECLAHRERAVTPMPFAEALVAIARGAA
jgi:hypothetical protein